MMSAALHPLELDSNGRHARLAGVTYLAGGLLRARDGRGVVHLTEAERPRHVYKFIGPLPDSGALQYGALYVARFGDNGHGHWLPLVPARQGFLLWDPQLKVGEVLADPAAAARRVGATPLDGLFSVQSRPDGGQLLLCGHAGPARVWREAMGDVASLTFGWQGGLLPSDERQAALHVRARPALQLLAG